MKSSRKNCPEGGSSQARPLSRFLNKTNSSRGNQIKCSCKRGTYVATKLCCSFNLHCICLDCWTHHRHSYTPCVTDVGGWVRMRRYPYQGDVAKVLDVELATQRAEIKYVPRIDYSEASQRLSSASLTEDGTLKKKAIKKIGGVRPAARSAFLSPAYTGRLQPSCVWS